MLQLLLRCRGGAGLCSSRLLRRGIQLLLQQLLLMVLLLLLLLLLLCRRRGGRRPAMLGRLLLLLLHLCLELLLVLRDEDSLLVLPLVELLVEFYLLLGCEARALDH